MTVKGKAQRLDVIFGPNYKAAVVWAPKPPAGQERNFICFEPMVGITNAVNMAHKGTYARAPDRRARRDLARELVGQAERVRGARGKGGQMSVGGHVSSLNPF